MSRQQSCLLAIEAMALMRVILGSAAPIGKVVQLLSDLQTKIISAQREYEEYLDWSEVLFTI